MWRATEASQGKGIRHWALPEMPGCCRGRAKYAAIAAEKLKAEQACQHCSARFRGRKRRFCTPVCMLTAQAATRRPFSLVSTVEKGRVCEDCDASFVQSASHQRFCGQACQRRANLRAKSQRRRAAHNCVDAERFSATEVFERDGWRCHLCRRLAPKKLRGTQHPRAPELDHIIPLSVGGSHTRLNTACSCRACNQSKGAKPLGQLKLVA